MMAEDKAVWDAGGLSMSDAVALAQKLAAATLDDLNGDSFAQNDEQISSTSTKDLYLNGTEKGFTVLARRIADRLKTGRGEAVVEVGVDDNGSPMHLTDAEFQTCLKTISRVADTLNADARVLSTSNGQKGDGVNGFVLIRRRPGKIEEMLELRICTVGNVDAGKSTLLGVLTKDVLDDGRGKARLPGLEIMGFNSTGEVVTPTMLGKNKLNWDDICHAASKVITFIDLAGHEKYLKTTVFGMTGNSPDFVMLMIGSNAGIIGMTKGKHLGLALALQVPVFIVVTKIDMCPKNVLESTLSQLTKILKSSGCRKVPVMISSITDVLVTAGNFTSERICPIFQVSNVSGDGLDLLKLFLNVINANQIDKYNPDQPVEYQITDTFSVPGVGTVVSGTVTSGVVHVGDSLLLGPDPNGHFMPTMIKSIQRKRVAVPLASAGHSASFALKKVKRSALRKGMVMLSKNVDPKAVYEFEAEILVLYHSTTISMKYQAMLHCGCVRQTAKIVGMDKQILRTGDRAFVRFRFMQHPEYLKIGTRLLFREGRTKGVGKVTRVFAEGELHDHK
ncbi:P-loop containing nucleoside triphosphate hydrolase protein [Gaertneriomyces semiglobifer]|nr:P-loop containing nucleoside triphosphate hydrolase protein [Gaertneriomyces semiglobifer]